MAIFYREMSAASGILLEATMAVTHRKSGLREVMQTLLVTQPRSGGPALVTPGLGNTG